ncbi:MAG: DUF481 domain-containing protein [Acidobacteriaceae bacterium]
MASSAAAASKPKPVPDVIIFTNGDQLSGQLVRMSGTNIIFKSDMAGQLTISTAKIKELHSSGNFALVRKDVPYHRGTVQMGTVTLVDKKITVANPAGAPLTVPEQNVLYLIDQSTYDHDLARKPGPLYGWNGSLTAGSSIVKATQNSTTFTGAVTLQRSIPTVPWLPRRNRTTMDANDAYGKVTQPGTPDVKTSIFHADAERDEYISTKMYALGQLAFDHNFSQGLDLAQSYGLGIGRTVFQSGRHQLDVKGDLHYLKQQFQDSANNEDLIGSTFAEIYRRNLPHKIVFNEQTSVSPAWNYETAFAAAGSASLAVPVYKSFSLSVATIDNYLNNPGVGFKKNSFQFTTGVTYSFK